MVLNMLLNKNFYVIGVYESNLSQITPTHCSPIIVERNENGYRRWHYKINKPYSITPIKPIGKFKENIEDLFPYKSYTLINPIQIKNKDQVIAIADSSIVVSGDLIYIWKLLVIGILKNIKNKLFVSRSIMTIRNTIG